jgi:hypothetical protein
MPFDISVDQSRAVVLVTFRGELAEADFAALEALGITAPSGRSICQRHHSKRIPSITMAGVANDQ